MKHKKEVKMFFGAFANPKKFEILKYLLRFNSATAGELSDNLKIEQTLLSHYLKDLLKGKFIEVKKEGKNRVYSLKEDMRPLVTTMEMSLTSYLEM